MNKPLLIPHLNVASLFKSLLTLLAFLVLGTAHAQVANYIYDNSLEADTGFSYTPIVGGTVLASGNWGEAAAVVAQNANIGFDFVYNGLSYSTIKLSSSGFVAFGGTADLVTTLHNPIGNATTTQYVGAISGFGRRLIHANFGSSALHVGLPTSVRYTTTGAVGSRIFIIQWENALRFLNFTSPNAGLLNFQIRLYEGSNSIEVHFAPSDAPNNNNNTQGGQTGLRGGGNTDFNNRVLPALGPWTSTVPGTGSANIMNMRTNPDTRPTYTFRMRWTPPCFAPSAPVVSNVQPTSANVNWTAPAVAPSGGYDWMVVSSGENPNSVVPSVIEASGNTTDNFITPLTGLPGGTTMVFWVRSNCGGANASLWIQSAPFTTTCDPTNVPYVQNFNAAPLGGIPTCTSTQVVTGNPWTVQDAVELGFTTGRYLRYNQSGTQAGNSWFYTQRVSLTAGTTYYVSYKYGGSDPTLTERLRVCYSMTNTPAAMLANVLDVHPEVKDSPLFNTVHFTPTVTGDYYFGFQSWSAVNQERLLLDDIRVDVSSCLIPTGLSTSSVTFASAIALWTEPTPAPSNGYAYYLSTSSVAPAYGQLPTGLTGVGSNVINLSGLSPNTTYYMWVRSNCGSNGFGEWSAVHSFTTQPAPVSVYCNPAPTSVDGQGIVRVQLGTIDNITGTEPNNYGDYSYLVTDLPAGEVANLFVTFNTTFFDYNTNVWVDWNNDGDFDDPGELVATGLSPLPNPGTLALPFTVPLAQPNGIYRLRIGGKDFAPAPGPCYNGTWGSFEDYSINVVAAPPALAITLSNDTICLGESSSLVQITPATVGNYNSYSWNPAIGVSGDAVNGYTFSPTVSTVYTLTGTQTVFPFSQRSVTFQVTVLETPSPITFTPDPVVVCATGAPALITKNGGVIGGVVIESQNFNDSTLGGGWTTTNNSVGGPVANSAFTLRPNGTSIIGQIHNSNDNSQFLVSNSDAQGSGNTTNVNLFSPVMDLTGYTSAELIFYHYYRAWNNGGVSVQISTNGGTTWSSLLSYTAYPTIGARNNFQEEIINLNAYTGPGFNNVVLRWNYTAIWGFSWALDNISIIGSAPSNAVWSPTTGLFTDAAGTIAYTGTPTNAVYAKPAATTTYTATVTSPTGCATSADVLVEVPVLTAGTLNGDQNYCSGLPADVVLSGNVPPVVRWEYSTTSNFAVIAGTYANTTTTLTGAEIGSGFEERYVRAVVSDGVCEGYSPAIGLFVASTVWNGSFWSNFDPDTATRAIINVAGTYTINSYLEACSLEIVSGNVIVASGVTLNLENELVVAPGASITFQNNASLLQLNDTEPNVGVITYRRNSTGMYLYDYTYWSSPVENQDLFTFSPFTFFARKYDWNEVSQSWRQLFPNLGTHIAGNVFSTAGRGFIVRAPDSGPTIFYAHGGADPRVSYEAAFVGVPNNGTITVPTSNVAPGWNLLGNPYPSALDVHRFLVDPSNAHLDRTIKYWTHNTPITAYVYNSSDYATYNFTGNNIAISGTGTPGNNSGFDSNLTAPGRYMASGQGFVIDVLGGNGPGTATFRNSHRVGANNNIFFRMAPTDNEITAADAIDLLERHRLWLTMSNHTNLEKGLLVGYVENATNNYDNGYDGKFTASGYGLEFYSLIESQPLTIQGRGLPFAVSDTVPLGFFAQQAGSYTVSLAQWDGLFQNQEVYIEDLLTGVIHPLKESNYSFVTETGRFDQRFVLRYTNETLNVNTPHFDENNVVVYKQDGKLFVQTQGVAMSQVVIYDISGRRLVQQQGELGTLVGFDAMSIAQQVLLVEITTPDRGTVLKKYVY